MNKGIHKNNTYLRKQIGNSGEVIINLNKNDAGLFIDIPIFTLEGISNFKFSLIYSSFSINNCKYGSHIRESYYYSLYDDVDNNKVYYTDAYNFEKEYTYFKTEYDDTCQKYYYKYDDETYIEKIKYLDNLNVDYNLYDKYGNKVILAYDKNYPVQIILKNGDNFTFENANRIVDNKGTIIHFSSDFLELKVFKNNVEIYKVNMIMENNYLSKIIHYRPLDEQLYHMYFTNEYVFDDVNKQIIIKDGLSNYAMLLNYTIQNNELYVDSYIEDYTNVFDDNKKNSILYYDYYTKILYNSGYYVDYYFNDNDSLIKKIDSNGQIEIFEYDQKHNIIKVFKNLNHAYSYVNNNSIFNCYLSYNNSIISNREIHIIEDNSIHYSDLIGNKALLIDNSLYDAVYSAEINANGFKGEYISLFLWSALISETIDSNLCITIELYKDNEIIQSIINEISNQSWNFDVFSDEVDSKYDKIKISITSTEGSIYKINGVAIFQKSFIANIEYDDNNNLTNYEFMSNRIENIYSNNKLFQQYSTTNLLRQTNYNSDDLVENKIFGNGTFQKVSYNDSNQVIEKKYRSMTVIWNRSIRMKIIF